jgi:SNF2 family DNA or RNA helicase
MGLGKTLQAITFLQMIAARDPEGTSLVIVPKSLVFNWAKELEKFAPTLTVLPYYGPQRSQYKDKVEDYQVIIATYGSVRSDVQDFKQINFNYIILDESQAIKNPDALVSKSVKLLKAKNRICMSGTPIENNTFDLYSQMDFLNPGMLGGIDFFKKEYANPIDRDKDEYASVQLRKLVYPFILRRTKEEVAKELPPKVESVIYCEMGPAQRRIYDSFKDRYRDMIMGRIEKDGLNNSAMYILEGLLKLRQICDSPAILNEETPYENASAKIEELTERISQDSGRHKILVFSQFIGMLDLIKKELDKLHVEYEYLDGQTTDRMERVENFQTNEKCRVFLMSLKAGGVGLNLTAADYVYLVDPWWNPAVEAQAIDRAHRIGQENSVFAYKMICKDTVEEKILALQEKKKAVAKDIINVETGFIKALDKEDVRDLFM